MRTITIEILGEKVLPLLKDLEQLKLIKLKNEVIILASKADRNFSEEVISKPALNDIEKQLDELGDDWK